MFLVTFPSITEMTFRYIVSCNLILCDSVQRFNAQRFSVSRTQCMRDASRSVQSYSKVKPIRFSTRLLL